MKLDGLSEHGVVVLLSESVNFERLVVWPLDCLSLCMFCPSDVLKSILYKKNENQGETIPEDLVLLSESAAL
jgi:hypothetical protein